MNDSPTQPFTWSMNSAINGAIWSMLIRKIKGTKPYIYIDHYGTISGIRDYLSKQKEYYPFFFTLIKLPIITLLSSGCSVLRMKDLSYGNNLASKIIKNYKEHLVMIKKNRSIGQLKFKGETYSVAGSIVHRLGKNAIRAFKQIADSIDIYEDFINKKKVNGALLSSDMEWSRKMIVRLFQKHKIKNIALMNGWFGTKHMIEYKIVDKVLCFGDSYKDNYFRDRENVKSTGALIFDSACKSRNLVKPRYPIKSILISTFTFGVDDINCHYNDSEKYLRDTVKVIKKYCKESNYKIDIALRTHPSDCPDFYSWYLKKLGISDIDIKSNGAFQKIVSNYDLYIASYSTTLFEAAVIGIPVIFYHPCNQILYPPFDGSCSELIIASSPCDLEKKFIRVMNDRDYAYKFNDKEVLKPYVGEFDGKSTSRIINEVIKMAADN